jgi:predicted nucleic acid-binding protein
MPPVGRPPAERNVYSFEGTLIPPPELVLDTSFVVDALIPSQSRHAECQAFLGYMAAFQSRVVFNRFLEPELWEAAYRIALEEVHPKKRAKDLRRDRRTLQRARKLHAEVEAAWREVLTALDWVVVELAEVEAWIPTMMRHGLSSYDAIHAATALYADVRPFVTLDYHFASVPGSQLQLWVPSNRVRPCRERRGSRAGS